jgi:hypothetical protein
MVQTAGLPADVGINAGIEEQLNRVAGQTRSLRDEANKKMKRCMDVLEDEVY